MKYVCKMDTSPSSVRHSIPVLNKYFDGHFDPVGLKKLGIGCISSVVRNKGYASALLSFLFDYAKKQGYSYIIGEISYEAYTDTKFDIISFYNNFGFVFYLEPNYKNSGVILKVLD